MQNKKQILNDLIEITNNFSNPQLERVKLNNTWYYIKHQGSIVKIFLNPETDVEPFIESVITIDNENNILIDIIGMVIFIVMVIITTKG
jgi:hypothetical protein